MSRAPKKPTKPPLEEARLAVNLPVAVHRALKRKAAERGVTIRQLVLELLSKQGIG